MKEIIFYSLGFIATVTAARAITHIKPMHMLFYFISFLLSISGIYFLIGSYFIGALEIIIYAGAITVLFVFVIMMLNIGNVTNKQEKNWLNLLIICISIIISILLLCIIIYSVSNTHDKLINISIIDSKSIGISLFGHYMIIVELISMLLLASLIVALHIGRIEK
ncbi:MAG: NADH-quinone oxidoreductase subunit J [Pantoea sp. Brub]|nr:NADH-quinone oxidoreductase subunit J [Pantoea sp. Brub]